MAGGERVPAGNDDAVHIDPVSAEAEGWHHLRRLLEPMLSWHIQVLIASIREHLFEAGTISATFWLAKDIMMQFARRFLIVSSMTEMIRDADRGSSKPLRQIVVVVATATQTDLLHSERDAMVMLCCPDERTRAQQRIRLEATNDRLSLTHKLDAIREGALDLPLQPVGETDVATWEYSTDRMVRIQSLHQMRVIAAVLRESIFEGPRRPTIPYDRWCEVVMDASLADRTWQSLFQCNLSSPVQSLTKKDFVWGLYLSFDRRKRMASHLMNLTNLFTLMGSVATSIFIFFVIAMFATSMGAKFSQVIVTCSTSFVALSFAFAGTITRIFESIVFILVMKPFEIGDRVSVDGEDYFVDKIEMMSSVLRKSDQRVMQISNTILATKAIFNHRRSGPASLDLRFMIAYDTMATKLQQLKKRVRDYVQINSDIWKPEVEFLVQDLDTDSAVVMTVRCHHRLNWQEKAALDEHRFDLAEWLRTAMNQLDISTSGSDKIVYDVVSPPPVVAA